MGQGSGVARESEGGFCFNMGEGGERGGESRGVGRDHFLLWLLISLFKKGLWDARQGLVKSGADWGVEGIVRRVEGDLRGRIRREERKWGHHAALERWKGGLGLVR